MELQALSQISQRNITDDEQQRNFSLRMYRRAKEAALSIEPGFVIDQKIREVFKAMAFYFTNNPEFEKQGFGKLSKGLLLAGNIGAGKTLLMRAFALNPKQRYGVIDTNRVNAKYQESGIESISPFVKRRNAFGEEIAFCFDDLGAEAIQVLNMGNRICTMEEIIISRYANRIPFYCTHFTSNLSQQEVEERYGSRIKSRLKEMVNILVLPGKDRRG